MVFSLKFFFLAVWVSALTRADDYTCEHCVAAGKFFFQIARWDWDGPYFQNSCEDECLEPLDRHLAPQWCTRDCGEAHNPKVAPDENFLRIGNVTLSKDSCYSQVDCSSCLAQSSFDGLSCLWANVGGELGCVEHTAIPWEEDTQLYTDCRLDMPARYSCAACTRNNQGDTVWTITRTASDVATSCDKAPTCTNMNVPQHETQCVYECKNIDGFHQYLNHTEALIRTHKKFDEDECFRIAPDSCNLCLAANEGLPEPKCEYVGVVAWKEKAEEFGCAPVGYFKEGIDGARIYPVCSDVAGEAFDADNSAVANFFDLKILLAFIAAIWL